MKRVARRIIRHLPSTTHALTAVCFVNSLGCKYIQFHRISFPSTKRGEFKISHRVHNKNEAWNYRVLNEYEIPIVTGFPFHVAIELGPSNHFDFSAGWLV